MSEQTLSDRVAELEAEREALATEWKVARERQQWVESRLAQARVEGAREALRYVFRQFELRPAVDKTVALEVTAYALRHKYPAPREEPRPAAPAAPEPLATDKALALLLDLLLEIMESPTYASRLRAIRVALAQTTEG